MAKLQWLSLKYLFDMGLTNENIGQMNTPARKVKEKFPMATAYINVDSINKTAQ